MLLLAVCILFALFVIQDIRRKARRRQLPPGPPGDPFLGHLRVFPTKHPEFTFREWAKQHGDVIYLELLGNPFIILNSKRAAMDLLVKRGTIYSDRPDFQGLNLIKWDTTLPFQHYGTDLFQWFRRVTLQALNVRNVETFHPIQVRHAQILLKNLHRNGGEWEDLSVPARRFTAGVTLDITYGITVESDQDAFIELSNGITEVLNTLTNFPLLDLFPSLKRLPAWFPGAWFIRFARDNGHLMTQMEDRPYEMVQRALDAGTARPSFVSMHLEEREREGRTDEGEIRRLKTCAMNIWTAGEETTWASVLSVILVLLLHPEVQRKTQQEIDQVVGSHRLPDFSDRKHLPYLECVTQEARRWHSVIPLGIPHRAMQDDIYREMLIPKGTTVFANAHAIANDEEVYTNPERFFPERYLPQYGAEPFPTGTAFGYGRRVCPGRYLAEASVWIVAASVLAVFNIEPVLDDAGKPAYPVPEFEGNFISHPKAYPCRLVPRSEEALKLLEQLSL